MWGSNANYENGASHRGKMRLLPVRVKDAFSSRRENLAPAQPEQGGSGGEGTLPGLGRPTVTLRGCSELLQTGLCPILEEELRGQFQTARE